MYYYSRRITLTLAAAITTLLALSLQTVTAAGLTSANTASAGTAHSAGSLSGTTSIADQARPDGAANWPVAGAKCKGDATSWCDMKMFIEAINGIGAIVDKVTIKFKITPHWDSADVLWKVTYQTPVHRYLHHFFVSAHVICLAIHDCMDTDHPIDPKHGSGSFKQQYGRHHSMRGSPVAIGLKFGAICLLCSAGGEAPQRRCPHYRGSLQPQSRQLPLLATGGYLAQILKQIPSQLMSGAGRLFEGDPRRFGVAAGPQQLANNDQAVRGIRVPGFHGFAVRGSRIV